MAEVAIPVVVDIEGAFEDAARRVASAAKPFEAAIDKTVGDIRLNFGKTTDAYGSVIDGYAKVSDLLTGIEKTARVSGGKIVGYTYNMKYGIDELSKALQDAKQKYINLVSTEAAGISVRPIEKQNLREAIVAIESTIELRKHEVELIERAAQKQIAAKNAVEAGNYALIAESNTISEIREKISSLRGKLENINPSSNRKEWNATAKEIEKATAQLAKYEQKLKATTKPGSIDRLRLEMQKLEQQWNSMSKRQKFDADGNLKASAQKIVDKYRELTAESEKYGQSLSKMAATAKPALDSVTGAMNAQSGILKSLTSYASMYISVFGLFRFAKQIRDVTAELEYQRVALGHLIQDEQYGAKLFEQIKAAAVESPFRITQLVTYTKQLAAYRIEQEKLFDTTKRLADISAGLGVDMNRLILAFGQVRAASVLRGQELRQFTEAGIPLVELLAEKFRELGREGTTTADVFKLISERAVPFSMIADIFEDLTDKGGMFYKMQEEQAATLKGRWEKLKDTYDIALQSIGETKTFENWNNIILGTLKFLAKNIRVLPKLLEAVTRAWLAYNAVLVISNLNTKKAITYDVALAASQKADATRIGKLTIAVLGEAKARELLTKAYAKQAIGATALSRAFGRLTVAMLSNPIGALIAGVAALTGLFFTFKKSVDTTADSLDYLDDAVENISEATKEYEKAGKLIERYEKLANKTDKTAKENERLHTTIEQLRDIYPELSDKIDDENTSLEEQIGLLKEVRTEREEQARLEAEGSYATAKKDLEDAEKRERDLEAQYQTAYQQQRNYEELGIKSSERYWRKRTEKIKGELTETRKSVKKLYSSIASLEKFLFPEQANSNLAEWQRLLLDARKYTSDGISKEIFSEPDVSGWESLGDAIKKLKPQFKEAKETYEGLVNAVNSGGKLVRPELIKDRDAAKDAYDAWTALDALLGGLLSASSSTSSAYKQDPFINMMQDRIKFMQDFKKGYDDLNKHMSANEALFKQGGIMQARGLSLGLDPKEQARAANDLSKWYSDAIDNAFAEAKKHGARGNSVEDFLSQQIKDTSNRGKALRDFQKLIQSLWDAKTDFDTSRLKKDLEDAFKRMTEEIKRSEIVRNFYQSIFDLTGDQNLAATLSVSVYGGIGNDFKDNLQRQLNSALMSLDASEINDSLIQAFNNMDFDTILKNIDKFTEDQQKTLRELASQYEKYNADIAVDLIKSLQNAKTYSEKRVDLAMQTAKRLEQINELDVPEETKAQMRKQNEKKEAQEAAKIAYEAFKDTPVYVELFANLDRASTKMLRNMRDNLIAMKSNWKDLDPTELKELQSRINDIDNQLAQKNPFRTLAESIREYNAAKGGRSRREIDENADSLTRRATLEKEILDVATKDWEVAKESYGIGSDEEALARDKMAAQKEETDAAIEEANAAQQTANAVRESAQWVQDAAEGMQKWTGYMNTAISGANEIVSTFASEDVAETFGIISQGVSRTLDGASKIGAGISKGLAGIPDIIEGITDVVVGIGSAIQGINLKKINKDIEAQQKKIEDLEKSYDRLEKAMAKSFGSDYIYNYTKQLDALQAKVDAYNEQARLEESKGKKADADKVKEYNDAAAEAEQQIADMNHQLSEFFTQNDLTSAAKDFANSWIEAYKEFGSTTSAMKEKFQDMIQSMVEQSLGAKIMQSILEPLFDSIDEMAASGGELSAQEIAQIAQSAPGYIDQINNAMTNLMNQLAAAGYNVRQGVGQFTGISRNIAGASEESINGLAAGINTQNFYMALISQNVGAILAVMTGSAQVTGSAGAAAPEDPYKKQMLEFVGVLPEMHDDMHEVRRLLSLVIKPTGTTSTYYLATRS